MALQQRMAFLGVLLWVALTSTLLHAETVTHPNILWVVSEDNTYNYVGAYGDPLARTPNIDRLAHEGIVFRNAHSTAPVCSASRASMITGMYASSLGLQHHRSAYPLPPNVHYFPEYLRKLGYFTTNNDKTDYNTPGANIPDSYKEVWNENNPTAHWRHRAPGQPFFAVFNFLESHEGSVYKRQPLKTDPSQVHVPAYLPDTPDVRADLAQYYDSVNRADERIGEVLKQLEADGLADDTIVFYYSDNGGVVSGSKRFLFDYGTHTALVVHFPRKYQSLTPPSAFGWNSELINNVDLAPTLLSLVGVPIPDYMQGRAFAGPQRASPPRYTFLIRDRIDERYDLVRAVTDGHFRYLRNFRPDLLNGRKFWSQFQASMRDWLRLWKAGKLNATQRAFLERRPPEQLFDCDADPDNVNDLAADPAYRDVLMPMRQALRDHLLAVRDTAFMPESLMAQLAGDRSPTVVSADPSAYPLTEILDFIDAYQLKTPALEAKTRRALNHALPVMRYWGVLAAMEAGARGDFTPRLKDQDETVRLAAAEAVIRTGSPTLREAWQEVTAALAPERSKTLRLQAANIVADNPNPPPEAVAALSRLAALKEGQNFSENFAGLWERVSGTPSQELQPMRAFYGIAGSEP